MSRIIHASNYQEALETYAAKLAEATTDPLQQASVMALASAIEAYEAEQVIDVPEDPLNYVVFWHSRRNRLVVVSKRDHAFALQALELLITGPEKEADLQFSVDDVAAVLEQFEKVTFQGAEASTITEILQERVPTDDTLPTLVPRSTGRVKRSRRLILPPLNTNEGED